MSFPVFPSRLREHAARPARLALPLVRTATAPWIRSKCSLGSRSRILILKPCCIGDVLMATPLVRALRLKLPQVSLTFAVGPWSRSVIAGNPRLTDILDTGRVGSGRFSAAEYLALVQRIRKGQYDACIVLERSLWLALLPALAGVPLRAGLDSGGRGFSHHYRVSVIAGRHETDLYLDVGRALGVPDAGRDPEFFPTEAERQRASSALADAGLVPSRAIAIQPGGGSNPGMTLARKRWPVARYAALARCAHAAGFQPFVVGGPNDVELGKAIQQSCGFPVPSLAGRLSLGETGAVLEQVAGYVGGDTGLTHLAVAVGTPTVGLFGPSDPMQYGPRAAHAAFLQGRVPCGPCFRDGAAPPCSRHVCMERIDVEAVWERLSYLMGERR